MQTLRLQDQLSQSHCFLPVLTDSLSYGFAMWPCLFLPVLEDFPECTQCPTMSTIPLVLAKYCIQQSIPKLNTLKQPTFIITSEGQKSRSSLAICFWLKASQQISAKSSCWSRHQDFFQVYSFVSWQRFPFLTMWFSSQNFSSYQSWFSPEQVIQESERVCGKAMVSSIK